MIPRYHKILILCINTMVLFFLSRVVAAAQCKTYQNLKFSEISWLADRVAGSLVAIFWWYVSLPEK